MITSKENDIVIFNLKTHKFVKKINNILFGFEDDYVREPEDSYCFIKLKDIDENTQQFLSFTRRYVIYITLMYKEKEKDFDVKVDTHDKINFFMRTEDS